MIADYLDLELKLEESIRELSETNPYEKMVGLKYQINLIEELIEKHKEINLKMKMRSNHSISIRKAMLIVFEELLKEKDYDRTLCEYDQVLKIVKQKKYKIGNRNKIKFNTLEKVHPKDPCYKYEELPIELSRYVKLLNDILENKWCLVDKDFVSISLENIYNEVRICK